jgi:hypothetical protein
MGTPKLIIFDSEECEDDYFIHVPTQRNRNLYISVYKRVIRIYPLLFVRTAVLYPLIFFTFLSGTFIFTL